MLQRMCGDSEPADAGRLTECLEAAIQAWAAAHAPRSDACVGTSDLWADAGTGTVRTADAATTSSAIATARTMTAASDIGAQRQSAVFDIYEQMYLPENAIAAALAVAEGGRHPVPRTNTETGLELQSEGIYAELADLSSTKAALAASAVMAAGETAHAANADAMDTDADADADAAVPGLLDNDYYGVVKGEGASSDEDEPVPPEAAPGGAAKSRPASTAISTRSIKYGEPPRVAVMHRTTAVAESTRVADRIRKVANTVVRSGWLFKQSQSLRLWKRRWFVLHHQSLCYYTSAEDPQRSAPPAATIPLSSIFRIELVSLPKADVQLAGMSEYAIRLCTMQRVYTLAAKDRPDQQGWRIDIGQAMGLSLYGSNILDSVMQMASIRGYLTMVVNGRVRRRYFALADGRLYAFTDPKQLTGFKMFNLQCMHVARVNDDDDGDDGPDPTAQPLSSTPFQPAASSSAAAASAAEPVVPTVRRGYSIASAMRRPLSLFGARMPVYDGTPPAASGASHVVAATTFIGDVPVGGGTAGSAPRAGHYCFVLFSSGPPIYLVAGSAEEREAWLFFCARYAAKAPIENRSEFEYVAAQSVSEGLQAATLMHPLFMYTVEPLGAPLTTLPCNAIAPLAVELSRSLRLYCSVPVQTNAVDYHVGLAQTIIRKCHINGALHSEFYAQLMAQLINHPQPDGENAMQHWQLLALALPIFQPYGVVASLLWMVLNRTAGSTRRSHNAAIMTDYCINIWNGLRTHRARLYPPSRIEVIAMILRDIRSPQQPLNANIDIAPGWVEVVNFHALSSVGDVLNSVIEKLRMRPLNQSGFGLFLRPLRYVQCSAAQHSAGASARRVGHARPRAPSGAPTGASHAYALLADTGVSSHPPPCMPQVEPGRPVLVTAREIVRRAERVGA